MHGCKSRPWTWARSSSSPPARWTRFSPAPGLTASTAPGKIGAGGPADHSRRSRAEAEGRAGVARPTVGRHAVVEIGCLSHRLLIAESLPRLQGVPSDLGSPGSFVLAARGMCYSRGLGQANG